eukprot:g13674.t1
MPHDETADLYSLGVLTWLLFTGGMPGTQPPVQPRPEVHQHLYDWMLLRKCPSPRCLRQDNLPAFRSVEGAEPEDARNCVHLFVQPPDRRMRHKELRAHPLFQSLKLPSYEAGPTQVETWLDERGALAERHVSNWIRLGYRSWRVDRSVKREGLIRDHWLIFGTGLFIFKTFPFFNYYFGVKVFGTSMWCWTMWHVLNRFIAKTTRRNEYMAAQKTAQEVMEGEDKIVESMRRFANDAKCVEYLKTFKEDSESKIAAYRKALVVKMQEDLTERASKQLQAIAAFEAGMGSAMQDLVVREAAASFKEKFPGDKGMQDKAFSAAVKALSGAAVEVAEEPPREKRSGERSDRAREAIGRDRAFFYFCDGEEVWARSEELQKVVDEVGYALPDGLGAKPLTTTSDSTANSYVDKVNAQLSAATAKLRDARLKAFVEAF